VVCVQVVALYVAWIDIDLVVNESSMSVLFDLCRSNNRLRALSCTCLRAVVSKGMDPDSKTDLIQTLELVPFIQEQFSGVEDDDENEYVSPASPPLLVALLGWCSTAGVRACRETCVRVCACACICAANL
jgi:hypothetical protein